MLPKSTISPLARVLVALLICCLHDLQKSTVMAQQQAAAQRQLPRDTRSTARNPKRRSRQAMSLNPRTRRTQQPSRRQGPLSGQERAPHRQPTRGMGLKTCASSSAFRTGPA